MDVIINNPPAQGMPAQGMPAQGMPAQGYFPAPNYFQGYGQGYGYAPMPFGPYGGRDHDGIGFFGVLVLILGGVLLARFLGRRARWERRLRMGAAGSSSSSSGSASTDADAEERPGFFDAWGRGRDRFFGDRVFGDRALSIARERLAKGEIGVDEYNTIKKGLE